MLIKRFGLPANISINSRHTSNKSTATNNESSLQDNLTKFNQDKYSLEGEVN